MSEPNVYEQSYGSPAAQKGLWFRRGRTIVIDLSGRAPSALGELAGEISEEISSPNAVIDPRIDVHAQFALLRMSKNPSTAADASAMLAAVKGGQLGGIYKEDQQVPALIARKAGSGWWQILPPGEDAALVLEVAPPIIVFRDQARSNPTRLDPALIKAFKGRPLSTMTIDSTLKSLGLNLSPAETSALASRRRVSLASRPNEFNLALARAKARFGSGAAGEVSQEVPRRSRPCGNCRGSCFRIANRLCLCFGGGSFISLCRVFDLPRPFP